MMLPGIIGQTNQALRAVTWLVLAPVGSDEQPYALDRRALSKRQPKQLNNKPEASGIERWRYFIT